MSISGIAERLLRQAQTGRLGRRVAAKLGVMPVAQKVRWLGADSPGQAISALAAQANSALRSASKNSFALSLGDGDAFHTQLNARLKNMELPYQQMTLDDALKLDGQETENLAIILCAYRDARQHTLAARKLAEHPVLGKRPFEHVAGLGPERETFRQLDEYADTCFVSPVLLDDPNPYHIYTQSLQYFEQKCGLRDYLDLYQLLKSVVDRDVPGDIAEFGSFRGHSGWLIAQSLQALGSDKRLFMFDTFESFPDEEYGVDHFWSATHPVDYEHVKAKFTDLPQVTLVKGDFTQTLSESAVEQLALAYVDCDSYRATRYLLQTLPEKYMPQHGVLVCEDYGHPALLGNRAAVHEAFDKQPGWFRYFSQFSGLYIALKLD